MTSSNSWIFTDSKWSHVLGWCTLWPPIFAFGSELWCWKASRRFRPFWRSRICHRLHFLVRGEMSASPNHKKFRISLLCWNITELKFKKSCKPMRYLSVMLCMDGWFGSPWLLVGDVILYEIDLICLFQCTTSRSAYRSDVSDFKSRSNLHR